MVTGSGVWEEMNQSFEDDWNSPYTKGLFEVYPP